MKCSQCEVEIGEVEDYAVCQNCGAICAEMIFVNCTPYDIFEMTSGVLFPRSRNVARCRVIEEKVRLWNDIPIFRVSYEEVTGLPGPVDRKVYIVSLLVKQACPDRRDLVCPGELVRDEHGQPIGCRGFRL